jgi:hypothetical protein
VNRSAVTANVAQRNGFGSTGRTIVLAITVLLGGVGVSLLRQRGAGALDTLWAEDGTIFLQAALRHPGPATWVEGYAGYLSGVPRLLGALAATMPVAWAAEVFAVGAALATAAVALVTYRAAEEHIPARPVRLALGLSVLLLAPAGMEAINSAANIHWYLLFASAWVALWEPRNGRELACGGLVLFLSAASDPFTAFAGLPLGVRLLRHPRASTLVLTAGLGVGLLLQAWVVLTSAGTRELDPLGTSVVDLGRWYGFRVLEGAVFGITLRDALVAHTGVAASAALTLALLAILLMPAALGARIRPWVPLTLGALHLAYFLAPSALAGGTSSRYSLAPVLLLYSVIAWGIAHSERRLAKAVGALSLALLATSAVLDFAPHNQRAQGPRWSEELGRASATCALQPERGATLVIPPLPTRHPEDPARVSMLWTVEVPCRTLGAGAGE